MSKEEVITSPNGDKYWYREGKYHREDGPAIERSDGTKYWYKEDKFHREDGPAIEYADGTKHWYYNGGEIEVTSVEEFIRLVKLKVYW